MIMNRYTDLLEYRPCNNCNSRSICFLRKLPLSYYPEQVQHFVITIPHTSFTYQEQEAQWHADYQAVQEQLVQYYDVNNCRLQGNEGNYLTIEAQKESDRKEIREALKRYLDIAAKAAEDKNPEISIIFDGIGLVLASDYLEAVSKVFSMFKTLEKIHDKTAGGCLGY